MPGSPASCTPSPSTSDQTKSPMRNAGTKPKSNERSSEPSALVRAAAVTKAADVCTPFESRDVSPPAPPTRVACKPASGPTRLITIV